MCCSAQVCQQNWPPSCTMFRSVIRLYRSEAKVSRGGSTLSTEQSAGLYKVGGSRARAAPGEHRAGGPRCHSATVLRCFGAGPLWPLDPETAARDSFPRSGFCRIVLLCPHRATKDHNHTSTQDAGSIWKLNCYYNSFLIQDT